MNNINLSSISQNPSNSTKATPRNLVPEEIEWKETEWLLCILRGIMIKNRIRNLRSDSASTGFLLYQICNLGLLEKFGLSLVNNGAPGLTNVRIYDWRNDKVGNPSGHLFRGSTQFPDPCTENQFLIFIQSHAWLH